MTDTTIRKNTKATTRNFSEKKKKNFINGQAFRFFARAVQGQGSNFRSKIRKIERGIAEVIRDIHDMTCF